MALSALEKKSALIATFAPPLARDGQSFGGLSPRAQPTSSRRRVRPYTRYHVVSLPFDW